MLYTVFVGTSTGSRIFYAKEMRSWLGAMEAVYAACSDPLEDNLRWRISWVATRGAKGVTVASGDDHDAITRFAPFATKEGVAAVRLLLQRNREEREVVGAAKCAWFRAIETLEETPQQRREEIAWRKLFASEWGADDFASQDDDGDGLYTSYGPSRPFPVYPRWRDYPTF